MAFPKVQQPLFNTTLPASKKPILFRQLTVREEKILLTAQASQSDTPDTAAILLAIKQLLQNCVSEPKDFDVNKLPAVDLEWLFLQIRSKSVSNTIELSLPDPATADAPDPNNRKRIPVLINLDDVKMHASEKSNKVLISEEQKIGVIMKHPTFEMMQKIDEVTRGYAGDDAGLQLAVIEACMDAIWQGEDVFPVADAEPGEVQEFLCGLNEKQIASLVEFLDDAPYLYMTIAYTDSSGTAQELKLQGISDFFGL